VGLRGELNRLTTPDDDLNGSSSDTDWNTWLEGQAESVARLNQTHPHDIRLAELGTARDERNCFMFALGINPDAIRDMVLFSIHPGSAFVAALIADEVLPFRSTDLASAEDGDVVVYFRDGQPRHAGVLRSGRVISKWGAGPTSIWDHSLLEVPEAYGDEIKIYRPLEGAESAYCDWAEGQGLPRLADL